MQSTSPQGQSGSFPSADATTNSRATMMRMTTGDNMADTSTEPTASTVPERRP
jgi:hypothetical protein